MKESTLVNKASQADPVVEERSVNTKLKIRRQTADRSTPVAQHNRKFKRGNKAIAESPSQEQLPVQEKEPEQKTEEAVTKIQENSCEILFYMQKKIEQLPDSSIIWIPKKKADVCIYCVFTKKSTICLGVLNY